MDQTKINDAVSAMCEKYKDNAFMSAKTESFICQQLPGILQTIEKNHVEQAQRITELNAEQDTFIQGFLASNRYFYASTTENFFYYDGTNYANVTEDEIIHNVLTSISRDRSLMSWKYKTKSAIMKRIKENAIFACIPESATIQSVLNSLYPATFATKAEAKYFLTVLGDNMLKKPVDERSASERSGRVSTEGGYTGPSDPLIHLLNPSAKTFINGLNAVSQMWFGVNLNQTFKYKYHPDHAYSQMRILHVANATNATNATNAFHLNGLNMLCVACHYSNRYQSSDNYLVKYSNDVALTDSTFFLKNATTDSLTAMFIEEYIFTSSSSSSSSHGTVGGSVGTGTLGTVGGSVGTLGTAGTVGTSSLVQVSWKNMMYLWKHFLESRQLPSIIAQTKLRNTLITLLEQHYSEDDDCFVGISSKYLPTVHKFLHFWDETMEYDETEPEIEIGEIATLFRQNTGAGIGETQIVNILTHFFPDFEIDQGKYIYRMRSNLWDKQVDIMMAMDDLRDKTGADAFGSISVYDLYSHYCNYVGCASTITASCTTTGTISSSKRRSSSGSLTAPMLVSKQYFEKYMSLNMK